MLSGNLKVLRVGVLKAGIIEATITRDKQVTAKIIKFFFSGLNTFYSQKDAYERISGFVETVTFLR
jgi:hypothetical protein